MGKTEVVKAWKPELRVMGFLYGNNMFQLDETKDKCIQFGLSIQKNTYAESYKINPTIFIRSPLVENARERVLLLANLRQDGIHLHVRNESWWFPNALPEALEALKLYALKWFKEWGQVGFLLEGVERAITERKSLIEVFEPLPGAKQELTAETCLRHASSEKRIAPMNLQYASILHYLAGDQTKAVDRTADWLASISPIEEGDRKEAMAQLSVLKRIQ
jgi:hypothetical protein